MTTKALCKIRRIFYGALGGTPSQVVPRHFCLLWVTPRSLKRKTFFYEKKYLRFNMQCEFFCLITINLAGAWRRFLVCSRRWRLDKRTSEKFMELCLDALFLVRFSISSVFVVLRCYFCRPVVVLKDAGVERPSRPVVLLITVYFW